MSNTTTIPPIWQTLSHGEFYPHTTPEKIFNIISMLVNFTNMLGNGLIMFMFARDRSLCEPRTLLILNLAIADFLWGCPAMVTELLNAIAGGFAVGKIGCEVVLFFASTGIAVSMQSFMWISVVNWVGIVLERPCRAIHILLVAASTWTVAACYSTWLIVAGRPAGGGVLSTISTYCEAAWMLPTIAMRGINYFTQLSYIFFLITTAFCYASIYNKFRRVRRQFDACGWQTVGGVTTTTDADTGGEKLEEEGLRASIVKLAKTTSKWVSIKKTTTVASDPNLQYTGNLEKGVSTTRLRPHKSSNPLPSEQAIILKFCTMVLIFSITWGTWVIGVVAYETYSGNLSPPWMTGLGAMMAYVNSAANPILFIGMDKRFKASAKRVLVFG